MVRGCEWTAGPVVCVGTFVCAAATGAAECTSSSLPSSSSMTTRRKAPVSVLRGGGAAVVVVVLTFCGGAETSSATCFWLVLCGRGLPAAGGNGAKDLGASSSSLSSTSSMTTLWKLPPPLALTVLEGAVAWSSALSLSLSSSIITRVYPAGGGFADATSVSSGSSSIVQLGVSLPCRLVCCSISEGLSVLSFLLATMRSPLIWVFPGDSASAR
mmetsp:Transcript_68815/g.136143  ORF Transcript_68815/g.136143 Transcript_68815/m.136143 type:complete len:214 (-) Transcript_68815:987-1628(-)